MSTNMQWRMNWRELSAKIALVREAGSAGLPLGGKRITVFTHAPVRHVKPGAAWATIVTGNILYRMFDGQGHLIYIGMTSDLSRRCAEHNTKPWWPLVEWITVQQDFPDRAALAVAEAAAIAAEHPFFNIEYNLSGWLQGNTPSWGNPSEGLMQSSRKIYHLASELMAIHDSRTRERGCPVDGDKLTDYW